MLLLMLGIAAPAFAADMPDTPANESKSAHPSLSSEDFVRKASQDGLLEVEAGNLALSTSSDANIKSFAQRMVTDHGKANTELASLVGDKYPVAKKLDAKHQAKLDALSKKSGADFDHAYSQEMMQGHATAVKLFTAAAASNGVSPELQQFASTTLPTLKEHHKLAMKLAPMK